MHLSARDGAASAALTPKSERPLPLFCSLDVLTFEKKQHIM